MPHTSQPLALVGTWGRRLWGGAGEAGEEGGGVAEKVGEDGGGVGVKVGEEAGGVATSNLRRRKSPSRSHPGGRSPKSPRIWLRS